MKYIKTYENFLGHNLYEGESIDIPDDLAIWICYYYAAKNKNVYDFNKIPNELVEKSKKFINSYGSEIYQGFGYYDVDEEKFVKSSIIFSPNTTSISWTFDEDTAESFSEKYDVGLIASIDINKLEYILSVDLIIENITERQYSMIKDDTVLRELSHYVSESEVLVFDTFKLNTDDIRGRYYQFEDINNIYVKDIDDSYSDEVYKMIDNSFISNGIPRIGLFENNRLIGAVLLENDYLPYEYRFDIIIDDKYRNKGYSKLLIEELINIFNKDKEADDLIAWVVNDNLKNILVKKYGFDIWKYEGEDFVGRRKEIKLTTENLNPVIKTPREILDYINELHEEGYDEKEFEDFEWINRFDEYILENVKISNLRIGYMHPPLVKEYSLLKSDIPPIVVDSETMFIMDGNHRADAAKLNGIDYIKAYVGYKKI